MLAISPYKKKVKEEHTMAENGFEEIKEGENDDKDAYMDYPPEFAILGWAVTDSTIKALISVVGGSSEGTCSLMLPQCSRLFHLSHSLFIFSFF